MLNAGKKFLTAILVCLPLLLPSGVLAKPAFWKLSDEDTTIYILGTFHLLQEKTVWYTHEMDDALKASDALYLELDPETNNLSSSWDYLRAKGFFADGVYLTDVITDREYYRIQEQISLAGGSPGLVFRMKPWLVAAVLSGQQAVSEGFDRNYGVEEILIIRAKKFKKPIRGMEKVDVQLRALADYPMDMQVAYLREVLQVSQEEALKVEDISRAWVNGDLDVIAGLTDDSFENFPLMEERILFERNRNWVKKIKDMMARPGTSFIAVGAGHLAGPKSVIELLEAEGLAPKRQ